MKEVNPVEAQRRKEKAKEIKKAKAQKLKDRLEKLAGRNTFGLQKDIARFEGTENRTSDQEAELKSLKERLDEIHGAKEKLGYEVKIYNIRNADRQAHRPRENRKSIYWDPVLNPEGNPPPGMPYVEVGDTENVYDDDDSGYSTSESVSAIPMPSIKPPSVGDQKKAAVPAKTTYESAPVMRNLVGESVKMVPAALRKKQKVDHDEPVKFEGDSKATTKLGPQVDSPATAEQRLEKHLPTLEDYEDSD